jgi:hypothetical protein
MTRKIKALPETKEQKPFVVTLQDFQQYFNVQLEQYRKEYVKAKERFINRMNEGFVGSCASAIEWESVTLVKIEVFAAIMNELATHIQGQDVETIKLKLSQCRELHGGELRRFSVCQSTNGYTNLNHGFTLEAKAKFLSDILPTFERLVDQIKVDPIHDAMVEIDAVKA